ncbi:glycosyltransferase [Okibacterium fritillariae]|uniref:glycosyltransferase n=1 Tax=Okibacterium fritillariae TaxID=123320 RepID=UPI00135667C3|nr:glycosyltransferase [Okibacterium fritillariae]
MNRLLLQRQVRRVVGKTQGALILWTFSPLTYGLEDLVEKVVYHSVDLLHQIDGLPAALILREEMKLLSRADAVITSSAMVQQHVLSQGANEARLWENVADVELYQAATPERVEGAVFAGNLSPSKINVELLLAVADANIPLAVAGPREIDGVREDRRWNELLSHRSVSYHGNLAPGELAQLLNANTVGLIPYELNAYTEGVFPMKVYEYVASGLSVVTTPLPSLATRERAHVHLTDDARFVEEVSQNLQLVEEDVQERKAAATQFSWTSRAAQARELISQLVGPNE